MFFIVPCVEDFVKVDLRVLSLDVPPQEVLPHGDFADRLVQNMSSDSTLMDNRNLVCLAMPSLASKSWLRGFMPGGDACKHDRFF